MRKTVHTCDSCLETIPEGESVTVELHVPNSVVMVADLCRTCAARIPARPLTLNKAGLAQEIPGRPW